MLALRCFTPKERLVCELLAEGLNYDAIALRLGMSYRTVNYHACNIYSKLGVVRKTGGLLKILESDNINYPATDYCKSKEQRIKVYQLRKEGLQVKEIAVKLRISQKEVYDCMNSISWFIKTRSLLPRSN